MQTVRPARLHRARLILGCDQRRQDLARPAERPPAVHRDVIVHQRHVAILPRDVEAQLLAQPRRDRDRLAVERPADFDRSTSGNRCP